MTKLTREQIEYMYKTLRDAIESENRLIYIVYTEKNKLMGIDHLEGELGTALSMKASLFDSQSIAQK